MKVEALQNFSTFYEIMAIFNLAFASSGRVNNFIIYDIFNFKGLKKTIDARIEVAVKSVETKYNTTTEKFAAEVVESLLDYKNDIPKRMEEYIGGFKSVYLLCGLYALFLIYLLGVDIESGILHTRIISTGGFVLWFQIVIIIRVIRTEDELSPFKILSLFVGAIIIGHFFNFELLNKESINSTLINLSNLFLVLPFLFNAIGVFIFAKHWNKKVSKRVGLINLKEDLNKERNRWKLKF